MTDDGKKSWREIDQMRDRGLSKGSKGVSAQEKRAQNLASKSAKQDLEKLFSSSPLNQQKKMRLGEIQSLRGKPGYYEKLDEFHKEFGVGRDWDVQMLFLDHRNSAVVIEVLQDLQKTAPTAELSKQNLLAQKLRVMEVSTFDARVSDEIKKLKQSLLRT